MEILTNLYSPGSGRPQNSSEELNRVVPQGTLLEAERDEFNAKVEMWNVDAAEDGFLAGKQLHRGAREKRAARAGPRAIREQATDIFDNLLCVNWDGAHGSRRITKRPWTADPYLSETLNVIIFEKSSIVRMIQNSEDSRARELNLILIFWAPCKAPKLVTKTHSWAPYATPNIVILTH